MKEIIKTTKICVLEADDFNPNLSLKQSVVEELYFYDEIRYGDVKVFIQKYKDEYFISVHLF